MPVQVIAVVAADVAAVEAALAEAGIRVTMAAPVAHQAERLVHALFAALAVDPPDQDEPAHRPGLAEGGLSAAG